MGSNNIISIGKFNEQLFVGASSLTHTGNCPTSSIMLSTGDSSVKTATGQKSITLINNLSPY